ncbi:ABC transporter permease subunit [Nonomuraea phyllanthi]|uniref:ABC transporter permease subunit n=1 Tax=Nonomuraea phyllanthi TaxID=2219224 RepID=A0A5C4W658_9ACTN|nr:ABC transporter permease [Nonomuraea phyllanthi]KAB8192172.1 ABC transporter permease subunit [Nonomuraea phyllanthi]QFY11475.1 ABC transporter permease subunit [Nonomuraea phyllanthi]
MTLRALAAFLGRRLLGLVLLLLIISFLVFSLIYLAPGNLVDALLGTGEKSPQLVAAIEARYHLDQPFMVQYLLWLKDAVQLDFGTSIKLNESVTAVLADRMSVTLFLGVFGFLVAVVCGLALGIAAALRRGTSVDRGAVGLAVLGVSTPTFATGLILLWVFGILLGWFPVIGDGDPTFSDRLWHLTLPAIALGVTGTALMAKMTRAALIAGYEQDYVGFARSRGVGGLRILLVYGLRNSLVPIVTAAGMVITATLTGSVLIEQTFSLKGVGELLISSINNKDIPVVQATTILVAVLVVVVNLLVDLSYFAIDPRTRRA